MINLKQHFNALGTYIFSSLLFTKNNDDVILDLCSAFREIKCSCNYNYIQVIKILISFLAKILF